jgi:glucosamine-6-phosphate deaminase
MSMTMSFIMNVPQAICVVPTIRKADAVYNALCGEVTTACPASILRQHRDAVLYLDSDSAAKL